MSPADEILTPRERWSILAGCFLLANADGSLAESERGELERLGAAWLPEQDVGRTLARLSAEPMTPEEIAGGLSGNEAREALWMCLTTVAAADARVTDSEREVLGRFARLLGRSPASTSACEPAAREAPRPADRPRDVRDAREESVERTILWCAAYAAAVGAVSERVEGDLALLLPAQLWMVRRIASHHGVPFDPRMVGELAGIAFLSAGTDRLRHAAVRRLAGTTEGIAGAASQFAVTYALGRTAAAYFERGRRADAGLLRAVFEDARRRGSQIQSRFASYFLGRTRRDVGPIVDGILGSRW